MARRHSERKSPRKDRKRCWTRSRTFFPKAVREQIQAFPLAAVALGLGVGIWLGMKKSDEIIAAGTALVSSAAMANVSQVMDKVKGGA